MEKPSGDEDVKGVVNPAFDVVLVLTTFVAHVLAHSAMQLADELLGYFLIGRASKFRDDLIYIFRQILESLEVLGTTIGLPLSPKNTIAIFLKNLFDLLHLELHFLFELEFDSTNIINGTTIDVPIALGVLVRMMYVMDHRVGRVGSEEQVLTQRGSFKRVLVELGVPWLTQKLVGSFVLILFLVVADILNLLLRHDALVSASLVMHQSPTYLVIRKRHFFGALSLAISFTEI